jgi:hypothetical protein
VVSANLAKIASADAGITNAKSHCSVLCSGIWSTDMDVAGSKKEKGTGGEMNQITNLGFDWQNHHGV